jgi:hypothetical protein
MLLQIISTSKAYRPIILTAAVLYVVALLLEHLLFEAAQLFVRTSLYYLL